MEILKKGTIPANRQYTLTCRNCGTEFRFIQAEFKRTVNDQRDGNCGVIDCPVCGTECLTNLH